MAGLIINFVLLPGADIQKFLGKVSGYLALQRTSDGKPIGYNIETGPTESGIYIRFELTGAKHAYQYRVITVALPELLKETGMVFAE